MGKGAEEWRKPFRIRDPARAFGQAFAKMLTDSGVSSGAKQSYVKGECSGDPIYTYSSKPLSFIVELMDKYSNNFIADSLVKAIDHEVNHRPGTAVGGIKYMKDEYKKLGIDLSAKTKSFVAGSGLTNDNAVSSSDFIKLVTLIYHEKIYLPEMLTSLPIAGIDGTLKKKYLHTDVAGKLRGKTGTLSGVQSLVGIYPNEKGEWILVSILVNGAHTIPENDLAQFLTEQ